MLQKKWRSSKYYLERTSETALLRQAPRGPIMIIRLSRGRQATARERGSEWERSEERRTAAVTQTPFIFSVLFLCSVSLLLAAI